MTSPNDRQVIAGFSRELMKPIHSVWMVLSSAILLLGLLFLPYRAESAHAQGCDPATGQQCPPTQQPACGSPGQPPCTSGSSPGSSSNPKPKQKPTKTAPLPVSTRTLTPTATEPPSPTATLTFTATDALAAIVQSATLMPRSTLPAVTLTEASVTLVPRPTSTPQTYIRLIFPIDIGGSSSFAEPLVFGVIGALIVIGILWFGARAFGNGFVREKPLIHNQVTNEDGTRNFLKITNSPQAGEKNFMKEVYDEDSSFDDSLRGSDTRNKTNS